MSKTPNIFTAFRPSGEDMEPFGDGDALLVLRRSGAVQIINAGYDRSRMNLPEEQQTEDDRFRIRQGEKLFALALAASNETVMDFLLAFARDPEVVDLDKLAAMTRLN